MSANQDVRVQFSGQSADEMKKTYAEFCSCHLKAVKLYKELLSRDKKFQSFIRVRHLPVLPAPHPPVEDTQVEPRPTRTRRAEGRKESELLPQG